MNVFLAVLFFITLPAFAIEDNSFLLEEAFNQEWGVFQFIQQFKTAQVAKGYEYTLTAEIPITDKTHQFSFSTGKMKANDERESAATDTTLNYRWQPFNKDGMLLAERLGLVIPTGSVADASSYGVYGIEFMQAATMSIGDSFMSHWNMGFNVFPEAEIQGAEEERTITKFTAGSSLVYLWKDNANFLLEGLLKSGQLLDEEGEKDTETTFILNPGMRFAIDTEWKEAQIVPGISFPTEILNGPTEHGVLLYLSVEPKFF